MANINSISGSLRVNSNPPTTRPNYPNRPNVNWNNNTQLNNIIRLLISLLQQIQQPNTNPSTSNAFSIPRVNNNYVLAGNPISNTPLGKSNFTISGNQLPSNIKGTNIISSDQDLAKLAQTLGIAKSDLPKIDFSKQSLIYNTQDIGDTNNKSLIARYDSTKEQLNVSFLSTAMAIYPQDKYKLNYYSIDKASIPNIKQLNVA